MASELILSVAARLAKLELEPKELFILAALDEHPHAAALCMPKPTVTLNLKRLPVAKLLAPGN